MHDFCIITPVLNQVDYLESCILSVLDQNVSVQHIIVDGGSTDGTIEIIRKYENRISGWMSEADNGQSHAINKGLRLADAKFFNWLNADDQLTKNALSEVLYTATADTDVVIGKCRHVDENDDELAVGGAQIRNSLEATLGNYTMGQPSVFYRTDRVNQLGGLNDQLHYCMDMDLWFRYLTNHGQQKVTSTNAVLSHFRVHPDSKSVSFNQQMQVEKYTIYHALMAQYPLPEVLRKFFADYPIKYCDTGDYSCRLSSENLFSHFCWYLMLLAYEHGDLKSCRDYFKVVQKGDRLSKAEKLIWDARLIIKDHLLK